MRLCISISHTYPMPSSRKSINPICLNFPPKVCWKQNWVASKDDVTAYVTGDGALRLALLAICGCICWRGLRGREHWTNLLHSGRLGRELSWYWRWCFVRRSSYDWSFGRAVRRLFDVLIVQVYVRNVWFLCCQQANLLLVIVVTCQYTSGYRYRSGVIRFLNRNRKSITVVGLLV